MKKISSIKRRLIYGSTALALSVSLLFTGCIKSNKVSETTSAHSDQSYVENAETVKTFDEFLDKTFKDEIVLNTVNLHYNIAEPEKYGIDNYEITLGDYSENSFKESSEDVKNYLDKLENFDYNGLSDNQRIIYDIFKQYLETESKFDDLTLYMEPLSSTIGEQAQLPIVMAEYKFYREQDVRDYLDIMKEIPKYFDSIIDLEKRKSEAGFFMCDYAVDDVCNQCREFISKPDENLMISTFDSRIKELNLSASLTDKYVQENLDAVKNQIIPAYQELIDELQKLKGTGKNEGGLCNLPKGKEYYQYLINKNVGTYRSVDEMNKILKKQYKKDIASLSLLYGFDDDLINKLSDYEDIDPTDKPETLLNFLRNSINDVFPDGGSDTFTVKFVDKSLENFVSPAMYLTPAIDKISENIIYINKASEAEGSELVVTLAHEGYPGHLYQSTYFAETNPSLIRNLLNFTGYTEGWATYAEIQAYNYGGLPEKAIKYNQLNKKITLNVYSQIDIGVNYDGWDKNKTQDFLAENFGEEVAEEYIDQVYYAMVEEPGNYLNYYFSYLEIEDLKATAKKELGDKFDIREFHKFLLDFGPAPFNIIEKYMKLWIDKQK